MVTYPLVSMILLFAYFVISIPLHIKKGFDLFDFTVQSIFAAYIVAVIDVTIFPLPVDSRLIASIIKNNTGSLDNFVPFRSILGTINNPIGLSVALKQLGGNLLLLFPMGFYLPILSKKFNSFRKIFLAAILFSVAIELIQAAISGILGFIYRSTDVDDVILNTIGCMLGFIAFKICYPVMKNLVSFGVEKKL